VGMDRRRASNGLQLLSEAEAGARAYSQRPLTLFGHRHSFAVRSRREVRRIPHSSHWFQPRHGASRAHPAGGRRKLPPIAGNPCNVRIEKTYSWM
jgi:hypothetical protein